jgi:NAD-dependent DNA ligase
MLIRLERFAGKSAENLINSVKNLKVPFNRVLYAIGIGVGETVARNWLHFNRLMKYEGDKG